MAKKPWKSRPQNLPRPDHTRVRHLPGAIFLDEKAFADCEPKAADYEAIVKAYELDGCVADLWNGLMALSTFDRDEIQWHADHPGKRMEQAYMSG
jgi:hypothetical protein